MYVKGKSEEDDGSFPGRITGKLILTYEDAAGNSYEESTEFESEIKEAKIQSLKIEDDQEETNSWWYSCYCSYCSTACFCDSTSFGQAS